MHFYHSFLGLYCDSNMLKMNLKLIVRPPFFLFYLLILCETHSAVPRARPLW
jgi:hypothetical protein